MGNTAPEGMSRAQLERFYRETQPAVYNVVYRWVWNAEDAADLTQEAFLRLWRMRGKVSTDTVRPLLFRIALNLASSRRRQKRLWRWVSLEPLRDLLADRPSPEQNLARRQSACSVRECISLLPEKSRQILLLCEFANLHYGDIARALKISPGTVGSRRHRALTQLKRLLEERGYALENTAT